MASNGWHLSSRHRQMICGLCFARVTGSIYSLIPTALTVTIYINFNSRMLVLPHCFSFSLSPPPPPLCKHTCMFAYMMMEARSQPQEPLLSSSLLLLFFYSYSYSIDCVTRITSQVGRGILPSPSTSNPQRPACLHSPALRIHV